MNTNPNVKRILCYGDSNTWGDPPDSDVRYSPNIRWTGILQEKLGNDFDIIEEGLCGRTTAVDDPKEDGRNGKTYLKPCIETQNPLDLVILMLGTNDLKERFNLIAKEIANNNEGLIKIIKEIGKLRDNAIPQILLISPALVNEHADKPLEGMNGAEEKSKQFSKYYKEVAERQNCEFLDISQYVQPSIKDGCHFDPESHAKVAETLEKKIVSIFSELWG